MISLIVCVVLTTALLVLFRFFSIYKINTFQAIVVNYWTCVITGYFFVKSNSSLPDGFPDFSNNLLILGVGIGLLFITTFYLLAITSQRISVSVSSIAGKMSMVIPVAISLFISKTGSYHFVNYLGMVLALVAVWFTAGSRKQDLTTLKTSSKDYLLVFAVFFMTGAIDSVLNFANSLIRLPHLQAWFPVLLFAAAAIAGTFYLVVTGKIKELQFRNIIAGVILGIPNYFSIYFLFKALTAFNDNGAFVYPLMNIGVILCATAASLLLFKEKLSRFRVIGLALSLVAIVLLHVGQ